MIIVLVAPELENLPQVELADDLMGCDQGVHVSFETKLSVHRFLVKLNLDEAVWVCSNDEVHLGPINHYHFFNVVDNVWQLSLVDLIHGAVVLARLEVSMKDLVLVQPFGLKDLVVSHFVRVVI